MPAPKIEKIAPPALPVPDAQFRKGYQDQLNSVQRLFYNRLTNTVNSIAGVDGMATLQAPHAMLMSDEDQASAGVTSANTLTYNQPVITQGIEVRNGGEIWFENPGQYLVTFTLQVSNRGNAAQVFEVWAAYDGSNYPLSNTRFDIPARKSGSIWSHIVPAITGIFTVEDPTNDYLSIKWWSDSTDVFIESYAEGTSPTRPAIPSVILTVNFISRLP